METLPQPVDEARDSALDLLWALVVPDGRRWGDAAEPFQVEDAQAILRFGRPNKHFLTRPRGGSKPLALSTPLPTPSGWTTMGDVRPGDVLLDDRGCPTRVVRVGEVRLGEACYRVEFAAGEPIVASADHEWVVEDRQIKANRGRDFRVTVKTTELRDRLRYAKRGDLRWGVPVAAPFDLPAATLPLPPYVFGAWLGDGSSDSSRVTIGAEDIDEASALFEINGYPLHGPLGKLTTDACTWRFGHPLGTRSNGRGPSRYDAQVALRRLGVLGNKHIPPCYLRASHKQRLELLRGLMDTDGHQSHSLSYFNTTSRRLADDVAELVATLGWKAWPQEHRAVLNGKDCGPAYRVGFRADESPFSLTRKSAKWSPRGAQAHRSENRSILAVEPTPSVPVRCITVDSPSHLYLAGRSAIPTHNSTDVAAIAVAWLATMAPPDAMGFVVSANSTQAQVVIRAAAGFISRTPGLDGFVRVEALRIISHNGASVDVMTQSDTGSWGRMDTHLLVCDEFCQWPDTEGARTVYDAVRSTVQKTPGCQLVLTSSPGRPSHWSRDTFEKALNNPEGWRVHQVRGPVPWQSEVELEELRQELLPSVFQRLVLGEWAESEDRAITPEDYEAARQEAMRYGTAPVGLKGGGTRLRFPVAGTRYVVVVDIGLSNDATAICVAHVDDAEGGAKRIVVDHLDRWQGSKKRRVDLDAVRDRVADLSIEYNRANVYADPTQFVGDLQRLNKRGIRAQQWTFGSASVGLIGVGLTQAFRNRIITVPHSEALRKELLEVRLRERVTGVTRLDHSRAGGGHDDQAVVIGLACHLLLGKTGFGSAKAFIRATEEADIIVAERRARRAEEPGQRGLERHLRRVTTKRQARKPSCDHRWRQEPPYQCAWGCGEVREP